jgi:hypothetical protein
MTLEDKKEKKQLEELKKLIHSGQGGTKTFSTKDFKPELVSLGTRKLNRK